jgi:hypothetical protein
MLTPIPGFSPQMQHAPPAYPAALPVLHAHNPHPTHQPHNPHAAQQQHAQMYAAPLPPALHAVHQPHLFGMQQETKR